MTVVVTLLALVPVRAFHGIKSGTRSVELRHDLRPKSTVLDGGYLDQLDMSSSAASYMSDVNTKDDAGVQSNLDTLYGSPASSPEPASSGHQGDYLAAMKGSATPAKSYGFSDLGSPKAPPSLPGDYLANVGKTKMPQPTYSAPPLASAVTTAPPPGDYLSSMKGSATPTKSYGFADDIQTKATPSYSAPAASPAPPATGDYLSSMPGSGVPTKSYGFSADMDTKAAPTMTTDPFASMKTAAPASSSSSTAVKPAPGAGDYLSSMPGSGVPMKSYGFSADMDTKAAPTMSTDPFASMKTAAPVTSSSSTAVKPAPGAGDYLSSMAGSGVPTKSYGFSADMDTMAAPKMASDPFASMKAAPPASSSGTSAVKPAPGAGDYLSSMAGSGVPTKSYGFSDAANVAPSMASDPFASMKTAAPPAAAAGGDYLSNMAGSGVPSRSYGFADDKSSTTSVDYLSNLAGSPGDDYLAGYVPPKPASASASTDYLSFLPDKKVTAEELSSIEGDLVEFGVRALKAIDEKLGGLQEAVAALQRYICVDGDVPPEVARFNLEESVRVYVKAHFGFEPSRITTASFIQAVQALASDKCQSRQPAIA